jgi:hypothetical protein
LKYNIKIYHPCPFKRGIVRAIIIHTSTPVWSGGHFSHTISYKNRLKQPIK